VRDEASREKFSYRGALDSSVRDGGTIWGVVLMICNRKGNSIISCRACAQSNTNTYANCEFNPHASRHRRNQRTMQVSGVRDDYSARRISLTPQFVPGLSRLPSRPNYQGPKLRAVIGLGAFGVTFA
jgi:hypothetical protein